MPFKIRLSLELHDEIERAAIACGLSKTDVIKLAVEAGLEDLARIKFRIGKAIHAHAVVEDESLQAAAEDQKPHGTAAYLTAAVDAALSPGGAPPTDPGKKPAGPAKGNAP